MSETLSGMYKFELVQYVGPDPTMEIETLQGTDIENGMVRSVRIKKRKKENWEGDRRKKN